MQGPVRIRGFVAGWVFQKGVRCWLHWVTLASKVIEWLNVMVLILVGITVSLHERSDRVSERRLHEYLAASEECLPLMTRVFDSDALPWSSCRKMVFPPISCVFICHLLDGSVLQRQTVMDYLWNRWRWRTCRKMVVGLIKNQHSLRMSCHGILEVTSVTLKMWKWRLQMRQRHVSIAKNKTVTCLERDEERWGQRRLTALTRTRTISSFVFGVRPSTSVTCSIQKDLIQAYGKDTNQLNIEILIGGTWKIDQLKGRNKRICVLESW